MEEWVRSLILSAVKPLRGIIDDVAARVLSVWSVVVGFFARVRSGWTDLRRRVQGWIAAQARHAAAVLTTLRWLITVYVPRKLGDLSRSIVAWTLAQIDRAQRLLSGALSTLERWARSAVDAVRGALRDLTAWARDWIARLRDDVRRLLDHVFGPLATASRLAAWIVGPLVPLLVQWAEDNAEALGRRLWAARVRFALAALDRIEDIVSRII